MRVSQHRTYGFTLLEISIVLLIVSVLAGGAAASLNLYMQRKQSDETTYKLRVIQDALLKYRLAFDRLPCPADGTYATSSQYYGTEGATAGTCTGGTPAANYSFGNYLIGVVPTKTLGLPDDAGIDGWGRKITYAIDKRVTANNVFSPTSTAYIDSPDNTTRVRINNATGGSITIEAYYALISHGANGHGGYSRSGALVNAASADTDEQANCECDEDTVYDGTVGGPYVQKLPTATFDDVVVFATRQDLNSYSE